MTSLQRTSLCVLLTVPLAATAWAQRTAPQAPASDDWGHGTTVSASLGAAADGTTTGATAGAALGWELRPRLLVEGSGTWFDRRGGSRGFDAALKVRAGLTRSGVSPFVEGGVGLYRLSTKAEADMPAFYRRRLSAQGLPSQVFTDPVFHLGAGVNVFTSRHLAVQPAAEMLLVTRGGSTCTLGAFSVRLAWHFEDHPVTK